MNVTHPCPRGSGNNIPDLADQQSKHKHSHEPSGRHEEVLDCILGFGVLADRGCSLGGEVEAPDISSALVVVHPAVGRQADVIAHGIVSAGVQVD